MDDELAVDCWQVLFRNIEREAADCFPLLGVAEFILKFHRVISHFKNHSAGGSLKLTNKQFRFASAHGELRCKRAVFVCAKFLYSGVEEEWVRLGFVKKRQSEILHDDGHGSIIEENKGKLQDHLAMFGSKGGITPRTANMQFARAPVHPPKTEHGEEQGECAND